VRRLTTRCLTNSLSARLSDNSIKIAKALEVNFVSPTNPEEARIKESLDAYQARLIRKLETGLFAQRKRLVDAERTLKTKQTKKALEDRRIATDKIEWHVKKLADLKRTDLNVEDQRIFPFWYAPVIVQQGDRRWIRPMRYHCRPNGKRASIDRQFDGLYNARRDSLENFWRDLYETHHAIMIAPSFFENVPKHRFEKRELKPDEKPENIVLHFNPQPPTDMLIACLWSHWREAGQPDLYSFAAITDDPPPEVAAAGHDRCIISIKPEERRLVVSASGQEQS
jgi:putative SOS response-associated peptidase YedK